MNMERLLFSLKLSTNYYLLIKYNVLLTVRRVQWVKVFNPFFKFPFFFLINHIHCVSVTPSGDITVRDKNIMVSFTLCLANYFGKSTLTTDYFF